MSLLDSCTVFIVFAGFFWLYRRQPKKHLPLPPGPPAEPIIGHARLIPAEKQEDLFCELGKEYGDIVYLKVPGKNLIILNSVETANELLAKKGAIYSDQPRFRTFEIMGWERSLAFLNSGKIHRTQRRMVQDYLGPRTVASHHHIQEKESRALLRNLLRDATNLERSLDQFSASIILNIVYGYQVDSSTDEYLNLTNGVNYAMGHSGSPGSNPVDFLPFLKFFPKWFPGAYYAAHARECKKYIRALHDIPFSRVQQDMAAGTAKPSLVSNYLKNPTSSEDGCSTFELIDLKNAAGSIYGAGGETKTSSTLALLFLAMLHYPECQKRAQQEIDTVIGSSRLPDFGDHESLPYINGVCQELLRWYPVAPLGFPRQTSQDDIFEGMYIPKGSVVIANLKAILWDERVYSNPSEFNPSRYLPKPDGNEEPYSSAMFGFGRRSCPGRYLAEGSLWVATARFLPSLIF